MHVDPNLMRLLGYTDLEALTTLESWERIVHPDDREIMKSSLMAAVSGVARGCQCEQRLLHRDGSYRWFLGRGISEQTGGGASGRIVAVFIDITDMKIFESSLLRTRADSLRSQRIAHIGNWAWNVRSGKTTWSDEVFRIFGVPRQEPSYELARSLVYPDDLEFWQNSVKRSVDDSAPFSIDYRAVRAGRQNHMDTQRSGDRKGCSRPRH